MRDLVTGATGFIGSHLTRALLDRGHRVRVMVRNGKRPAPWDTRPVEVVRGDLTDPADVAAAMTGIDRVFHCAALVSDWGPAAAFRRINVGGVANLLAAAQVTGIRRLIHLSTTDVYGFPDAPVGEDAPLRYRGWPYVDSKIDGERLVWRAAAQGLPVTVIRPANVYGVGSHSFVGQIGGLLRSGRMIHLGRRTPPAGLCHVDHLVDVVMRAAERPGSVGEAYNVLDGSPMAWRTFIDRLADAIGAPRPRRVVPREAARMAAWCLEAWHGARRRRSRPLLTRLAVELFTTHQGFRIAKARRDLDFVPGRTVAASLPAMARWLEEVAT
jgi:nucleoside-diphosphate-sugar epimerase